MIESLMLIALGFFVATLFAAIAAQFVWRRAVTVTRRSLLEMDAETAEEARVLELDDLMQRHRRETAPLEMEINRLRNEKDALASSNDDLARENTALTNEINALRGETRGLGAEVEALRTFIGQNSALAAERIAVLKQEIYALEAVIGDRPEPGSTPVAAPALPPEPEQAVARQDDDAQQVETDTDADQAERTLAEVKASLARLDAMTADDRTAPGPDDRLTEAHIGDKALLARIKALEAGVAN